MAFLNIQMNIKFPAFPIIFIWIKHNYDKCENLEDYINFMLECFYTADETDNEIKKQAYYSTACVIFSKLTGKSWESLDKKINECQN